MIARHMTSDIRHRFNKHGQLKLSFGMIFSIILIISFLAFGFITIQKFLSLKDDLVMKKFQEDFQSDLKKSWESEVSSREVSYNVLPKVDSVCIVNDERNTHNVEVYMDGIPTELKINYIDVTNSTNGKKSICVKAVDNKIKFLLEKRYGQDLVTIKV